MTPNRFETIIDGYFPLSISLGHMMGRLDAGLALVEMTYAPIMDIPGLPPDAPVPLNIRAGRAGIIEHIVLRVERQPDAASLSGHGIWHWLDGTPGGDHLDSMTRLAEPAIVAGYVLHRPTADPGHFGADGQINPTALRRATERPSLASLLDRMG